MFKNIVVCPDKDDKTNQMLMLFPSDCEDGKKRGEVFDTAVGFSYYYLTWCTQVHQVDRGKLNLSIYLYLRAKSTLGQAERYSFKNSIYGNFMEI